MVFKHIKETIPLNLRMKTNIIYFYSQLSKLDDQVFRVAFECEDVFGLTVTWDNSCKNCKTKVTNY